MTAILSLEQLGRIREVAWRASASARHAEATGSLYLAVQASLYLALCCLAADRPAEAAAHERIIERWPPEEEGFLFQHWLALKAACARLLYGGDPKAALARVQAAWPGLQKSSLLDIQFLRVFAQKLQADALLTLACEEGPTRAGLLAEAKRLAHKLEREKTAHASAAAAAIQGAVAHQEGQPGRALASLEQARRGYQAADMGLHAAAVSVVCGQLGAEAEASGQVASDTMRSLGIACPERWSRLLVPGFR